MSATKEQCRTYRQRLKERVRKIFGAQCQTCGADPSLDDSVRLELAHKRPTGVKGEGRGLTRRMLDAIRNRDAYILECRPCHYVRDHGYTDQSGF
jgi:hypothetical protein